MNINNLLLVGSTGALVAFGATLAAQESSTETGVPSTDTGVPSTDTGVPSTDTGGALPLGRPAGGAPVRPLLDAGPPLDAADTVEFDLRQNLALRDLDAREAAFDDAARQAARDPDIRRALQIIAGETGDPDLAFTARLALREADRLASWGRAGSGFGGHGLPSRPDNPFDAMRQRMESMFGSDPFVDRFFGNDPFFSRPYQGHGGVFGVDPFAASDPFEAMRQRIEEMERSTHTLRITPGATNGQSFSSHASVSVETTPDGVRVQVEEDDGSGPKRTTYEAESIEALLEQYPELRGRIPR